MLMCVIRVFLFIRYIFKRFFVKKRLFISGSLVVFGLMLNALLPVVASAEDLSPSEVFYRDHIVVYNVAAKAPQLKNEAPLDPGGSFISGGGFVGARSSSGRSRQTSSRSNSNYTSSSSRSSSGRFSAGRR